MYPFQTIAGNSSSIKIKLRYMHSGSPWIKKSADFFNVLEYLYV